MIKVDYVLKQEAAMLGINKGYVNPASVDLALGGHIIEFCPSIKGVWTRVSFFLLNRTSYNKKVYNLKKGDEFTFKTDCFYLCHSQEKIQLPNTEVGMLFLKSSAGRRGLEHSHAGWVDNGFRGNLTWEITAHMPSTWKIGDRMCQLVIMETLLPEKPYEGKYQDQKGATEAK